MLTRRRFISATVAASISMAITPSAGFALEDYPHEDPSRPGTRLDALIRAIDPSVDLYNPHTQEHEIIKFYGSGGYNKDGLDRINYMFRDWRQDKVAAVDIRVIWGVAALRSAAIKQSLSGKACLNSGYRTKKTNASLPGAARKSFHLKAKAADVVFEGARVRDVAAYAEWLQIGGTGVYGNRFTHIDSGPARKWFG